MNNTVIYNSKRYFFIYILMDVALFGCGVYLLFTNVYLLGLLAIIGSFFFGRTHLSNFKNRTPKIVLSVMGIRTNLTGYKEWSEICSCKVIPKAAISVYGIEFYLRIEYSKSAITEEADILIDDLGITKKKLKELIRKYSGNKFYSGYD